MRANRPIGLISRDYIPIECIQNCEALFRSTCFGKSGGISSLPADCRRYADQLCVELNNRFPLNTVAACPFSMRSEERRVGKECRSRWLPYAEKKNVE